jgi:hypothetical protein
LRNFLFFRKFEVEEVLLELVETVTTLARLRPLD